MTPEKLNSRAGASGDNGEGGRPPVAALRLARYIWAAPNSLIGLLFVPTIVFGKSGLQQIDGVLELHGSFIAWLLRYCVPIPGGALAITFGHVVLGRDRDALRLTRRHERVHVRQYERWGPAFIPAYLAASLYALASGTGAYRGNLFEQEAMRADRQGASPLAGEPAGRHA